MDRHTICIMNDSFPPQLDGVAMTSRSYADMIERYHGHAVVVTPEYPDKDDGIYPYPVIRYPSLDARWFIGYMAGIPFSPALAGRLKSEAIELMHCHCPAAALFLARELRVPLSVPVILTYHTKYDIDLMKAFRTKLLSDRAVRVMIANIESADEVWTVSRGAGDNLRSLGYEGECVIMPNGVDMERKRASEDDMAEVLKNAGLSFPPGVPVFLFVGRMFWYKGTRLILDAAARLSDRGREYRIIMIGEGEDYEEIKAYAARVRVDDRVHFLGSVYDREELKAWYSLADALLFPSTYDTNGLVVREAASAYTPAILIEHSCAAEGVTDLENGFIISETAEDLSDRMESIIADPMVARTVGERAGEELYISWKDAVDAAVDRYEVVLDRFKSGYYPKPSRMSDSLLRANGELMSALSRLRIFR